MSEVLDPKLSETLGLFSGELVEETKIARIWKVQRNGQSPAALKIYRRTPMGGEQFGFEVLATAKGEGAVEIYQTGDNFALMEWVCGPSLGDMSREGKDKDAARILVEVANHLHSNLKLPSKSLPTLANWFSGMFDKPFGSEISSSQCSAILRCKDLTAYLLSTQEDIVPLHGDLHHDNVKRADRGYVSFDAKGILGDRTYELANAFRNPRGMKQRVYDHERILYLADLWSAEFEVDRTRLLQWASVKCAWSISLKSGPIIKDDDEFKLLDLLLAVTDDQSPS